LDIRNTGNFERRKHDFTMTTSGAGIERVWWMAQGGVETQNLRLKGVLLGRGRRFAYSPIFVDSGRSNTNAARDPALGEESLSHFRKRRPSSEIMHSPSSLVITLRLVHS
jgi:hypothetical protein